MCKGYGVMGLGYRRLLVLMKMMVGFSGGFRSFRVGFEGGYEWRYRSSAYFE